MITVREISPDAWRHFEDIFQDECDGSDLPSPEYGTFLGAYDENGHLKAWLLTEKVVMIGQVFSVENGKSDYVRALIRHLKSIYPMGVPVACVASEDRFKRLFESLGMDEIKGTLYRR